jgi:hypothetical protein
MVCLKLPSEYLSGGAEEKYKSTQSMGRDSNPGPQARELTAR